MTRPGVIETFPVANQDPPRVIKTPPRLIKISIETPPMVLKPSPMAFKTSPMDFKTSPMTFKTPPKVIETLPSVIGTPPSVIGIPPSVIETSPSVIESATTNHDSVFFSCTAGGCKKSFQAPTAQLVRKALMRHLFRYQKRGVEVDAEAQNFDLTAKQIFDRSHYLAYKAEILSHSNLPPTLHLYQTLLTRNLGTSEEKQAASRAKYKEANKEKVARASRISNYRAQAKKKPEIMGQGMEAVYKWAEEKEEKRKS